MKRGTARIDITAAMVLVLFAIVYPSRSQTRNTPVPIGKLVTAAVDPIMTDPAAHDLATDVPPHMLKSGKFTLFGKGALDPKNPYNDGPGVETRAAYAKLPLSFVPNAGQLDARVRYSAQSGGAAFYFTAREAVFSFAAKARGLVLRLGFLDANPQSAITGQTAQSSTVNYLIGNDRARWHTKLPTYGEVAYRDLWPGIDLLFRGEKGQLTYEFLLRAGARLQDIRLAYRGAKRLSIDHDGNLVIHTSLGSITDTRPVTYQLIDGERVQVASRFALQGGTKTSYGFTVGSYDHSRDLIVDPGLVYSTYLGGSGDDGGEAIAVDSAGQAYVAGWTYSPTDFPTTSGAFQRANKGGEDTFVTKLNSRGSALVYSTYLGGTLDEPYWSASIAIDCDGYAYVAGTTLSRDFPTTPGAFQTSNKGLYYNAFVTKLNRDGSNLVYSTYLGGSNYDGAYYSNAIAVDSHGNAYVTGFADSPDFPTTPGAYQTSPKGPENAFVTKLNTNGTGLVYSTFLGGSTDDVATGIAVDSDGEAYVTGYAYSTDFPTRNPHQSTNHGAADAFVTELNSSGTDLVYSTYLGGAGFDTGAAITVDWSGAAYVVGDTGSTDFPTTPGAFQTTYGGGIDDVFVTKLNKSGSALVYSTYLGGTLDDYANAIVIDTAGQAHVTGTTDSTNFPTTLGAYDTTYNGTTGPMFFDGDAFVTKLNSHGSALVYSTYLGGSGDDLGLGIAVDRADKVYVTGSTNSGNFPTTPGAYDITYNGAGPPYFYGDAFVAKLDVPVGEAGCDKADGDGEADENNSGRKNHFHFHKRSSCPDQTDTENDNVQSDDSSGSHFTSTSFTSSTFDIKDNSQAITLVGTGLHNGLPVTFTMVAVNYGDVAPAVFQITLTDGYTFIGSVVSRALNIQ
jgi:hypothetical protein